MVSCFTRCCVSAFALALATCRMSTADDWTVDEFPSVWNLRPRDSFLVDVMIHRQTRTWPDDPDTKTANMLVRTQQNSIRDRLTLEYRVQSMSPNGNLQISVSVRGAVRSVDSEPNHAELPAIERQLDLLKNVELLLELNSQGDIESVNEADRTSLVGTLTGTHPDIEACLQTCCSADNVAAWFAKPFWFRRPVTPRPVGRIDPDQPDVENRGGSNAQSESPDDSAAPVENAPAGSAPAIPSRDVRDVISLGSLGTVDTIVRLSATTPSESERLMSFSLAGHGRFVPVRDPGFSPIGFAGSTAKLTSYSGTALVSTGAAIELQSNRLRPAFHQLDLNYVIEGTCELVVGQQRVALRFEQTQTQAWTLRASQMQRNFLDQSNQLERPTFRLP